MDFAKGMRVLVASGAPTEHMIKQTEGHIANLQALHVLTPDRDAAIKDFKKLLAELRVTERDELVADLRKHLPADPSADLDYERAIRRAADMLEAYT
jgi:hypothetical protein